jgi:hypothetical protein
LGGVVELDETYELRSYKGQRVPLRAPRQRGGKGEHARHVQGACATAGGARPLGRDHTDFVLDPISIAGVSQALHGVVAADAILCTDGTA